MPNTTPNPTPSEADVKASVECAKSLGMYDLDWHKDRTERIVEIMEEIISRHMQPERDELERLRFDLAAAVQSVLEIRDLINPNGNLSIKEALPVYAAHMRAQGVVLAQSDFRHEVKQIEQERAAAQKKLEDIAVNRAIFKSELQIVTEERAAAQKEVERLRRELETADDLYARLAAKEQAEFRTIEQQKAELTAFRNAMGKGRDYIMDRAANCSCCAKTPIPDDFIHAIWCRINKQKEAVAAIEAVLRDPPQ